MKGNIALLLLFFFIRIIYCKRCFRLWKAQFDQQYNWPIC